MGKFRRLFDSEMWNRSIPPLVILLLLVSVFVGYQEQRLSHLNSERIACQTRYNDSFNARTKALSASADAERQSILALDTANAALWLDPAIGKPAAQIAPEDTDRILAEVRAYQAALSQRLADGARATADRQAHPVPDAPSAACK